ncbi:MAG: hypothetical protein ABSH16_07105 [Sedimentisphaerales bacterium]
MENAENRKVICGNEFPEFCYKAYENEDYTKQFIENGIFRLNCLHYCKNMEGKRRDPTEGRAHTLEPNILSVGYVSTKNPPEETIWTKEEGFQESRPELNNPIFCFCTCLPDVDLAYISDRFKSKYIVKINEPRTLAEEIASYLSSRGENFMIVGCKVVYNKGKKLEKKLTANDRLDLAYKQKPESFSLEREFRIVAIKFGDPCNREGCKYLDGQFEQVDPGCKYIEINLNKQLNYLSMMNL